MLDAGHAQVGLARAFGPDDVAVHVQQVAVGVLGHLELAAHVVGGEGEPDEEGAVAAGTLAVLGLEAAHTRTHAPGVIAESEPVAHLGALAVQDKFAADPQNLVEAHVVLHGAAVEAGEVVVFLAGRQGGLAQQVEGVAVVARFEHEPHLLPGLDDVDAEGTAVHLADVGAEGAGEAQVVLLVALVDAGEALLHVHVLVGGEAHDELQFAVVVDAVDGAVEEAMVAGEGVVEGGRALVGEGFVEPGQHGNSPSVHAQGT